MRTMSFGASRSFLLRRGVGLPGGDELRRERVRDEEVVFDGARKDRPGEEKHLALRLLRGDLGASRPERAEDTMDFALDGFWRAEFALDELLREDPNRRRGDVDERPMREVRLDVGPVAALGGAERRWPLRLRRTVVVPFPEDGPVLADGRSPRAERRHRPLSFELAQPCDLRRARLLDGRMGAGGDPLPVVVDERLERARTCRDDPDVLLARHAFAGFIRSSSCHVRSSSI